MSMITGTTISAAATMRPVAFLYDRHATVDTTELERRLRACTEYFAAQCWGFGGRWLDTGDFALVNDHRPAFDALVRSMQSIDGGQPRVCLVHDWDRISRDSVARGVMTRRILLSGGWVETCSGDKRTTGPALRNGQLTSGPVTA